MNAFSNGHSATGAMYVKALYDYVADDRTSLSFRQGDVIQVITQLDSGWWDGVIHGVRGWFPSNYCAVVSSSNDIGRDTHIGHDVGLDEESDEEYGGLASNLTSSGHGIGGSSSLQFDNTDNSQEEAAFWIPQATPDGRLFYFNTLTGVSTMELPLETPSGNDSGPRDRTDVYIPDQTRPPAELLAGGYQRTEEEDESASDADASYSVSGSQASLVSAQTQPARRHTNVVF